jgi:hypothetical protein
LELSNFQGDNLKHAAQILRDVRIPETQHRDTALTQPNVALSIFGFVVPHLPADLRPVQWQAQSGTIEVEYKAACGALPSEIDAKLSISELLPQTHFDVGRISTQTTSAGCLERRAIEARDPHPASFARRPPPFRGR